MTARFRDSQQTIYDFMDEILVHCPRCNGQARVIPLSKDTPRYWQARRVVCTKCGYTKDGEEGRPFHAVLDEAHDCYFHLPLWLQTPCCGHILWAYNTAHLDFLENYVRADLREDAAQPTVQQVISLWRRAYKLKRRGIAVPPVRGRVARNSTLASRLPRWIKSAKNRADVLRCVEKLRKMLDQ